MPQQSVSVQGLYAVDVKAKIELLIDNLVNIKDQSGKFLLRLADGRVIDTKGWNDWEWTWVKPSTSVRRRLTAAHRHGIGLNGLWQYYTLDGSPRALEIMQTWYKNQLSTGTTKNINTMVGDEGSI